MHFPDDKVYPVLHLVQAVDEQIEQPRLQATQLEPENLYPSRQVLQVVALEQTLHPVEHALQVVLDRKYPDAHPEHDVLDEQVVQILEHLVQEPLDK